MNLRILAGATLVAVISTTAAADTVIFRNGTQRQGRVEAVDGDPNRISFMTEGQTLQLRRDQVQIIEDTDAVSYAILGEQFLRRRSYPLALQMFQRSLRAEPGNERATTGLERTRALMDELQSQREREALERNSEALQEARQLIRDGRFQQAEAAIAAIATESPSEEQRALAQAASEELYLAWAHARLDRLDPAGAEVFFNKVLEANPDSQAAKDGLLQVWERNPARSEQVLEIFQERLAANPEDLELNRRVANLLLAANRPAEAVEPLKRVVQSTVLRGEGYGERLRGALLNSATTAAGRGDLTAAIAAYEDLLRFFPNEDPTPLAMLQYEQRLAQLPPGDFEARAALIEGLRAQGLVTFALREADLLLRDDPQNATALAMLRADAVLRLSEIQTLMGRGEFFTARDLASSFVQTQGRFPDLVDQASEMFVRADLEAQRLIQQTREQARNLVSQGDQFLAEARSNATLLGSNEFSARNRAISFRQEAIRNAERAVQRYETALRIDPSVGPPTGLDVNTKLEDARRLLASLTASATRRPSQSQRTQVSDTTRN